MSKKPNDAERDSKKIAGLTSILQSSNKSKEAHSPAPLETPSVSTTTAPVHPPKKEKVGKYRDPNYHHYGVYLRKDTHKRVKRRLEDTETDMDLSDLLQVLLEKWLTNE